MRPRLIIIILLFSVIPASAQWQYGGKVVGQYANGYTDDLALANVGNGTIVVAWNGVHNGKYAIFAQKIDSAGFAMWPDGGLVVYEDSLYRQHYPAILPDVRGGVFIVWSDWRHTWAQGVCLYGQRLISAGVKLWDPNGARLTADTFSQGSPKLFSDGQGGFVVVYETSYGQIDVGAQRASSSGQILWDSTGIFLTRAWRDQWFPKTCKASDSTFITIWKDERFGDSLNYDQDIYMQKFNLSGNVLWDSNGIPAVHWPWDQGYTGYDGHDITADGHGGAVVVWVDSRTLSGGHRVLFADRFSPSGQSLWRLQGKQLGNEALHSAYECQVFRHDSTDTFFFRWEDSEHPEYFRVTHLDLQGNFIGPEVVPLDTFGADRAFLDADGTFKSLIIYGAPQMTIAGRKCDLQGTQYWETPAYVDNDNLEGYAILSDGYGGMTVVWMKPFTSDIRITRIYSDGQVGGDTTAVDEENYPRPEKVTLYQNYPNPFNSETTIKYSIGSPQKVNLELFNIIGQRILSAAISEEKGGVKEYKLDLSGFSSGTYFLRMSSGDACSKVIILTLLK